jgi:hypothetical protein
MAFTVKLQKLVETQQRIVVKFIGIANAVEDESDVLKLTAATTAGSATLLATKTIASVTKASQALRVSKVYCSVGKKNAGVARVDLRFAGSTSTDTDGLIASFGEGETFIDFNSRLAALVPDPYADHASITSVPGLRVSTTGFAAQESYTMIVELKKSGFSTTTIGWAEPG